MINDEADKVMKEVFDPLKYRFLINLELMKGSGLVFDYIHLLYYKCHKINPNHARSYIDSPDWIKNKKAIINPINKKHKKCFQYAVTVALNHKKSKKIPKEQPKLNFLLMNITGKE